MKNGKLLAFVLLMAGTLTLQAQQRKCEMSVELISPAEGDVIQPYAQYNLIARVTNNGPDILKTGDTLFYNIPTLPSISYKVFILQDSIPVNNNIDLNLQQLVNINDNQLDETSDFYVKLVSNLNGTGAFRDTFLTNNTDINTITYKPCGINGSGTAVNTVNRQILDFTLFPNPVLNSLRLETKDLNVKNIFVTDLSGRTLISKAVNFNSTMELDITTLPSGMYFLKLDTDKGIAASKFIKQ